MKRIYGFVASQVTTITGLPSFRPSDEESSCWDERFGQTKGGFRCARSPPRLDTQSSRVPNAKVLNDSPSLKLSFLAHAWHVQPRRQDTYSDYT